MKNDPIQVYKGTAIEAIPIIDSLEANQLNIDVLYNDDGMGFSSLVAIYVHSNDDKVAACKIIQTL